MFAIKGATVFPSLEQAYRQENRTRNSEELKIIERPLSIDLNPK